MSRIPTHRTAEHPGTFLRERIEEMGLTVARVAEGTGLAAAHLREIVRERRGVSAETAIALGTYFGQSPEFWMNAQTTYELSKELIKNGRSIRTCVRTRTHIGERAAL